MNDKPIAMVMMLVVYEKVCVMWLKSPIAAAQEFKNKNRLANIAKRKKMEKRKAC